MTEHLPHEELEATRSFYDRISKAYDLLSDASERAARDKGLEQLAVRPGEKALEIGFGTGHALVALAEAVGPAGSVAGVDISEGMRDVALGRLKSAGLDGRVDLRVEAAPPLNFDDASFDAVFMSFTLELFPAGVIPTVLAEARRVLKPGGRLGVVAMAEKDGPPTLIERAYAWMHRHFPHIVDCRPIDVCALLDRTGFRREAEADLQIWSIPVKSVVARR